MVGDDDFRRRADLILGEAAVEHDWQDRDRWMADAFRTSVCQDWSFVTDTDFEQIDRHRHVLHFQSAAYGSSQAAEVCHAMLALGARLLEADGWAMKCESSGVNRTRETWLTLASRADHAYRRMTQEIGTPRDHLQDQLDFWRILVAALVDSPIQIYSVFYTCGMHLLGQPDLILDDDELDRALGDIDFRPTRAAELFETFALRLLTEYSAVRFPDGQTIRIANHCTHCQVTWEGCPRYVADDCLHNPIRAVAVHASNQKRFAEPVRSIHRLGVGIGPGMPQRDITRNWLFFSFTTA